MNMHQLLCICWFTCLLKATSPGSPTRDELLLQHPGLWPGHLEPFGSNQNVIEGIEELLEWPHPETFFAEYVDKSKPVLFKGLAKRSPGFKKFNDEYFRSAPGAEETIIYAEPEIKENRTKYGYHISIKEFIERYHKETLYMVDKLPQQFCSDVLLPGPLRCESSRKLMEIKLTWLSNGGTKSVLHNDDVDNINCLFRGTKQFWFIDYKTNAGYVPIDMDGGYSSMDVEKVNYTAYPDFRKVDFFHRVIMEEGDCLFIPWHWYHQVNSFADQHNMNLAVNVWFKHQEGHLPTNCSIPEGEATLDKWEFSTEIKEQDTRLIKHFAQYTEAADDIRYNELLEAMKIDILLNPNSYQIKENPKKLKNLAGKVFNTLDINGDGKISKTDWKEVRKFDDVKVQSIEKMLKKYSKLIKEFLLKLEESEQPTPEENTRHDIHGEEL